MPQFRLTTESGVPVSSTDRTSQGTLFATPSTPTGLSLAVGFLRTYTGSSIREQGTAQVSLSLSVTSGKNYDVFIKNSDLSLVLSSAWTDDTTRADGLTTVQDLIVASADNTYLWLGTIRASGSNVTADSGGGATTQVGGTRYVWNAYNQVPRQMVVIDTTDNWSYTTDTIRQANGAAGNKVEYVTGDATLLLDAFVHGIAFLHSNSGAAAKVGVGIDSTTTFSGLVQGGYNQDTVGKVTPAAIYAPIFGHYAGQPGLGYHAISWNEKGADGTCLFLGDNGGDGQQSGLIAVMRG